MPALEIAFVQSGCLGGDGRALKPRTPPPGRSPATSAAPGEGKRWRTVGGREAVTGRSSGSWEESLPHRSKQFGAEASSVSKLRFCKDWFHGLGRKLPRGSREADRRSYIPASNWLGPSSSRQSRLGGRSEAGFDVLPVYRDLRQLQKGKSGVISYVKQGEMRGVAAVVASTLR